MGFYKYSVHILRNIPPVGYELQCRIFHESDQGHNNNKNKTEKKQQNQNIKENNNSDTDIDIDMIGKY